jgi:hypothetical protein
MQERVADQVMFFELALSETGSEVGTVNRHVELFEYIRKRAKMIFVPVGKNDCCDVVAIGFEKIEVGYADVNTVGGLFGKAHARVKDEHLILVSHGHAIHPKLADPAERNDL